MPHGPKKLILIKAGRYDFAEVELAGSLQIVGPNNTGKTTLINTLQFLYLDDRRHMDFGGYSAEQTRDYYFPNQYSYVLFQCLGSRGQLVFGWRGQSKAASGEPERFCYEGSFQRDDFLDEQGQVREPRAVTARLAVRQFALLNAHEHRELLLQATKMETRGVGLVALRDNNRYPQFRETLKDLLSLRKITQAQMRNRLLMLAGLATEKHALNVRELFGEDYDKIRERKRKLARFKDHQSKVEVFVDACARRERTRGELIHRWKDLRPKRASFVQAHETKIEKLREEASAAQEKEGKLKGKIRESSAEKESLVESRGNLTAKVDAVTRQEEGYIGFVEEFTHAALANTKDAVHKLRNQLSDTGKQTREKAEAELERYRRSVQQKRQTIDQSDRALITVLRRSMTDEELSPLARLFNFDLLHGVVGDDGIRLQDQDKFIAMLRLLRERIQADAYRDRSVVIPLPTSQRTLAELANPEAVRERLADEEMALRRCEEILEAIDEREKLAAELEQKKTEESSLEAQIVGWKNLLKAREHLPQLQKDSAQVRKDLEAATAKINHLEAELSDAQTDRISANKKKQEQEDQFGKVMDRLGQYTDPSWAKPIVPDEAIPDDLDAAVALYLRQQSQLQRLDKKTRDAQMAFEKELGSDYSGADEDETVRLLREELEALADKEDALSRDWEFLLHELRATFDQVLRSLDDIKSAATQLNRRLSGVQVSNLAALRMDIVEQTDFVSPLRRLVNVEQPGLFDDNSGLEATINGFRRKFEANPLLRYTDLFSLRFSVTGDDGKPHHYEDLDQVESHGTTITIKVLFNLLVLRSLLREDASKSSPSEIPFFLDEIHSLDPANRHAIISTSRKLGFIAITAAPESVSEVDALYYLNPSKGRVVLRNQHRIGIKAKAVT